MNDVLAPDSLKPLLSLLADGHALSREQARDFFSTLLSGQATPSQIGAFLMALRLRGVTVDELAAGVAVMRERMLRIHAPEGSLDIVGTGGDGAHTYNISTAAAFLVAGCGIPVAKHGNRAVSSRSGAADVIAGLGIPLDLNPSQLERCLSEAGLAFLFAPQHHHAVRHVATARSELGIRTVFNLMGPLCNPADVKRYLLGVYDAALMRPMLDVLQDQGAVRAFVVHGAGGLDEVTPTGDTHFLALQDGIITEGVMTPEDFGLPRVSLADLRGGDAMHNAAALEGLLGGEASAYRVAAVMNAAVALVVGGGAEDFVEGVAMAEQAIVNGQAMDVLRSLRYITQP